MGNRIGYRIKVTSYFDFEEYLEDAEERIFRYWVYRRMFTPIETEKKFIDESFYEDSHCHFGMIVECISLNEEDYHIGFQDVSLEENTVHIYGNISYYKLSEIRMAYLQKDQITDGTEVIIEDD